jgi:hypothetical protein
LLGLTTRHVAQISDFRPSRVKRRGAAVKGQVQTSCILFARANAARIRLINKNVGVKLMVDGHNLELGSWQPSQGRSKITGPDAPPAAVFKLDNVTLVVPRN